jgi:crossover junction endodeoxyribonuclease RusA
MIIVELPYPPSTNRMWRNYRGRMVLSDEGETYKAKAGWLAKAAGAQCVKHDIALVVTLHPRTNKDGSASGVVLDLDNSLKVACDSLQGIAYANDKQIKRLAAAYGAPMKDGGLTVAVMPADDMKAILQ